MYPYYKSVSDDDNVLNAHPIINDFEAREAPYEQEEKRIKPKKLSAAVSGLIIEALKDEATYAKIMEQLMSLAESQEDKEIIRQIRMDEQKHYKMFQEIYDRITGEKPHVEAEPVCVGKDTVYNYEQNIFTSLKAADFYMKLYIALEDMSLRDMLYEIIVDEQSHATQFTCLYAKWKI